MPYFAKYDSGYIGLQGDHGSVMFRNIKILPLHPQNNGRGPFNDAIK